MQITTPSLNVLEGSSFDLICKITSVSSPELCVFYKDSQRFNATEPIRCESRESLLSSAYLKCGPGVVVLDFWSPKLFPEIVFCPQFSKILVELGILLSFSLLCISIVNHVISYSANCLSGLFQTLLVTQEIPIAVWVEECLNARRKYFKLITQMRIPIPVLQCGRMKITLSLAMR